MVDNGYGSKRSTWFRSSKYMLLLLFSLLMLRHIPTLLGYLQPTLLHQAPEHVSLIGAGVGPPPSSLGHGHHTLWDNEYNVVHVVNTQFLQHEGALGFGHLAEARLNLFETFCWPAMLQQTTKQFLWIIWTDPSLDSKIMGKLKHLVSSLPNAVLLGVVEQSKTEDFRSLHGIVLPHNRLLDEVFIAGNKRLLLDYHIASQSRLLLETKLDGDDALRKNFIESVQAHAARTIGASLKNPKMLQVFCPEHHIEWRYFKPDQEDYISGHLIHHHNINHCLTSGLTVAYHLGATNRNFFDANKVNVPQRMPMCSEDDGDENNIGLNLKQPGQIEQHQREAWKQHDILIQNLIKRHQQEAQQFVDGHASEDLTLQLAMKHRKDAMRLAVHLETETQHLLSRKSYEAIQSYNKEKYGSSPNECWRPLLIRGIGDDRFVEVGVPFQAAILLSRTPVSAGMDNVIPHSFVSRHSVAKATFELDQDLAWEVMAKQFSVQQPIVEGMRGKFEENMEKILTDAIAAQCSQGYSCKATARNALKKIMDSFALRKKNPVATMANPAQLTPVSTPDGLEPNGNENVGLVASAKMAMDFIMDVVSGADDPKEKADNDNQNRPNTNVNQEDGQGPVSPMKTLDSQATNFSAGLETSQHVSVGSNESKSRDHIDKSTGKPSEHEVDSNTGEKAQLENKGKSAVKLFNSILNADTEIVVDNHENKFMNSIDKSTGALPKIHTRLDSTSEKSLSMEHNDTSASNLFDAILHAEDTEIVGSGFTSGSKNEIVSAEVAGNHKDSQFPDETVNSASTINDETLRSGVNQVNEVEEKRGQVSLPIAGVMSQSIKEGVVGSKKGKQDVAGSKTTLSQESVSGRALHKEKHNPSGSYEDSVADNPAPLSRKSHLILDNSSQTESREPQNEHSPEGSADSPSMLRKFVGILGWGFDDNSSLAPDNSSASESLELENEQNPEDLADSASMLRKFVGILGWHSHDNRKTIATDEEAVRNSSMPILTSSENETKLDLPIRHRTVARRKAAAITEFFQSARTNSLAVLKKARPRKASSNQNKEKGRNNRDAEKPAPPKLRKNVVTITIPKENGNGTVPKAKKVKKNSPAKLAGKGPDSKTANDTKKAAKRRVASNATKPVLRKVPRAKTAEKATKEEKPAAVRELPVSTSAKKAVASKKAKPARRKAVRSNATLDKARPKKKPSVKEKKTLSKAGDKAAVSLTETKPAPRKAVVETSNITSNKDGHERTPSIRKKASSKAGDKHAVSSTAAQVSRKAVRSAAHVVDTISVVETDESKKNSSNA